MVYMEDANMNRGGKQVISDTRLVSLPVMAENIFHFPGGLPAFEKVKEFVLLCPPDLKPFFIMQALDPKDLAFVCIDPFMICPGYSPVVSEEDVKALALAGREDVFLFSIVTVRRDAQRITANLQGPVVINVRTGIGRQVLCSGKSYPVQYSLWEAAIRLQPLNAEDCIEQVGTERVNRICWPMSWEQNGKLVSAEAGKEK